MLQLETITPEMQSIASSLHATLDESWYLAGGTALALQIGHRSSVDLDYFSPQAFYTEDLKDLVRSAVGEDDLRIVYEAPYTLWCDVRGVKVSFIMRSTPLLEAVTLQEPFRLAAISDITVMKLLAICSREEYKDYFDLACISRITDVRSWVRWWEVASPNQDYTSWLVALAAGDTVSTVPLLVTEKYESLEVATTLSQVVREITEYVGRLS